MTHKILALLIAEDSVLNFDFRPAMGSLQGGNKQRKGQDASDFIRIYETHRHLELRASEPRGSSEDLYWAVLLNQRKTDV